MWFMKFLSLIRLALQASGPADMNLHFCTGFLTALVTCASRVIPDRHPGENRGGIQSSFLTPKRGSPFLDQSGRFGQRLG